MHTCSHQASHKWTFPSKGPDACVHGTCKTGTLHISSHVPPHMSGKIHLFHSQLLGTHTCSRPDVNSSPNKNFIHCSQILYRAQVSHAAASLWAWLGGPERGCRLGLPVMDGINLLSWRNYIIKSLITPPSQPRPI